MKPNFQKVISFLYFELPDFLGARFIRSLKMSYGCDVRTTDKEIAMLILQNTFLFFYLLNTIKLKNIRSFMSHQYLINNKLNIFRQETKYLENIYKWNELFYVRIYSIFENDEHVLHIEFQKFQDCLNSKMYEF